MVKASAWKRQMTEKQRSMSLIIVNKAMGGKNRQKRRASEKNEMMVKEEAVSYAI